MANYMCTIRTNYFHVIDENKFLDLMNRVYGEDTVNVFRGYDNTFGFGCYGGISGIADDDDDDIDDSCYDDFLGALQECVSDDDAILIFEVGNEKLRYVTGWVTVVTNKSITSRGLDMVGREIARKELNNAGWTTQSEY